MGIGLDLKDIAESRSGTAHYCPPLGPLSVAPPTETILEEAQRLVHGDRGAAYGHPEDDYKATGEIWGAILERAKWSGGPVDPRIACLMMVGVKVSREAGHAKRDNRVDGAGYFECVDMIAQRQEKRGAPPRSEPTCRS